MAAITTSTPGTFSDSTMYFKHAASRPRAFPSGPPSQRSGHDERGPGAQQTWSQSESICDGLRCSSCIAAAMRGWIYCGKVYFDGIALIIGRLTVSLVLPAEDERSASLACVADPAVTAKATRKCAMKTAPRGLYITLPSHVRRTHVESFCSAVHEIWPRVDRNAMWARSCGALWALTMVPGPDALEACRDITQPVQSPRACTSPPRPLFAPAVLGFSLPPAKTCMRDAQWSVAPGKPIY